MGKKLSTDPSTGVRWKYNWKSRLSFPKNFIISFDISLRNIRCEGKYLECLLNIFSDYDRYEISLGDLLQCHNYLSYGHPELGKINEEDCLNIAINEGDEWLERNKKIIDKILKYKIVKIRRWEEWRNIDLVNIQIERIKYLLENDGGLRSALLQDVNRLEKHMGYPLSKYINGNIGKYIVEEIAVYMYQSVLDDYVHVYPGGTLKTLDYLRKMDGAPVNIKFSDHVYVYLK